MNNPTLKKEIIQLITTAPLMEALADNRVAFFTSCGMITGTPVVQKTESRTDTGVELMHAICENATDSYHERHPEVAELAGNDGFVLLKDVVVQNGSVTFNVQMLVVFFDQIIAATLRGVSPDQ